MVAGDDLAIACTAYGAQTDLAITWHKGSGTAALQDGAEYGIQALPYDDHALSLTSILTIKAVSLTTADGNCTLYHQFA